MGGNFSCFKAASTPSRVRSETPELSIPRQGMSTATAVSEPQGSAQLTIRSRTGEPDSIPMEEISPQHISSTNPPSSKVPIRQAPPTEPSKTPVRTPAVAENSGNLTATVPSSENERARPPSPPQNNTAATPMETEPLPSAPDEGDAPKFTLRVTKELWLEFRPDQTPMEGAGQLFFDFTDSTQKRWARGEDIGNGFGRTLFATNDPINDVLPARLFDLVDNRVVLTNEIGFVHYTIVSHVWGNVIQVDGSRYGVDWKVPVSDKVKIDQISMRMGKRDGWGSEPPP